MSENPMTCSYVLLTYNQEETVYEALQSALAQECQPIEIIVSDDCSKDNTFQIIQETVSSYKGPHTIILNRNERNLGLAGHIDRIHDLSTGDIIIAAAGDDISLPNRSRRIIQAFEESNPLLVCSLAEVIDASGNRIDGEFHEATFYATTDLKKVAKSKSLYIGASGAWHRDLYRKYGKINPLSYEDIVFGFRAALEGRVVVIEEKLVKYRLGFGITSSTLTPSDIPTFIANRVRGFVVIQACFQQRLEDASTYGLDPASPVWRMLEHVLIKSKLGHYYYEDRAEFRREAVIHPFLALNTIYSERRRKRKIMRRLARQKRDQT
ncbi:glycosyltransferase [Roseovarius sp. S1116L3]|uniref:glycosyltransferase n=1 Tax=Roseovarius roseus TaxID=3342636 RepID=UPI003726B3B9